MVPVRPELRERAVLMVAEVTPNYASQWAAIGAVAQKLGIDTAETVRKWFRQAEVDAGQRPGTTTDDRASALVTLRLMLEVLHISEAATPSGSALAGWKIDN